MSSLDGMKSRDDHKKEEKIQERHKTPSPNSKGLSCNYRSRWGGRHKTGVAEKQDSPWLGRWSPLQSGELPALYKHTLTIYSFLPHLDRTPATAKAGLSGLSGGCSGTQSKAGWRRAGSKEEVSCRASWGIIRSKDLWAETWVCLLKLAQSSFWASWSDNCKQNRLGTGQQLQTPPI